MGPGTEYCTFTLLTSSSSFLASPYSSSLLYPVFISSSMASPSVGLGVGGGEPVLLGAWDGGEVRPVPEDGRSCLCLRTERWGEDRWRLLLWFAPPSWLPKSSWNLRFPASWLGNLSSNEFWGIHRGGELGLLAPRLGSLVELWPTEWESEVFSESFFSLVCFFFGKIVMLVETLWSGWETLPDSRRLGDVYSFMKWEL